MSHRSWRGTVAAALFVVGAPCAQSQPAQIAGRVIEQGMAVPGAHVVARWLRHPELPPSIARALGEAPTAEVAVAADLDGRFRLEIPGPVPVLLEATAPDGRRAAPRFPVLAHDFVELDLCAGSVIRGVVRTRDGRPAGGSTVEAVCGEPLRLADELRSPSWRATTRSAADGTFRLEVPDPDPRGVPLGLDRVRARRGDWISAAPLSRRVGQSMEDVVLTLDGPTTLGGVVVDRDGVGIEDAVILDTTCFDAPAHGDRDGRFVLRYDGFSLAAWAPGYAVHLNEPQKGRDDHRYCLAHGPVVRARLTGTDASWADRRVLLAVCSYGPLPVAWLQRTDADGTVTTGSGTAGSLLCGFVELEGRFVYALGAELGDADLELGDVRVDATRTTRGQVLDRHGIPVSHARVVLVPETPPMRYNMPPSLVAWSDRAGRFRFEGAPRGAFSVHVFGGSHGLATVSVAAGEVREPLDVRFADGPAIAGHVTFPDGAAGSGATIVVRLVDPAPERLPLPHCRLLASADGEGRFVIHAVPPGHRVEVSVETARDGTVFQGRASTGPDAAMEIVLRPARD